MKAIQAKVQKGLNYPALADQVQELKVELEKDFNDLIDWLPLLLFIGSILRTILPGSMVMIKHDQLKVLGLLYSDAEEQWIR